jgi:uncharacterized protein (TIGR02246 family)
MSENRVSYFFVILVFGFVVCYPAIFYPQVQNEIPIRERVQEYENAFNRGDAKAVAAIYDVNGSHTYANGIINRGRLEIERGLAESFVGPMKGTHIKLTPEVIRFPANDVAVEEASFILTGLKMPDGTDVGPIKGLCLAVYHKQNNEWFAFAVQCMVPPPPQN